MGTINNLILDKASMETAINTFENKKMALENSYLKISNEVRDLDGTWHGEASERFKAQFDALYDNLKQCETVMSNVVSNLKSALSVYEEQEKDQEKRFEGLDQGHAYRPKM